VSIRALEIMEEQDLTAKAERLGHIFRDEMAAFKSPIIKVIRGRGLLNAVVIDESAADGRTAWDLCLLLKEKGLLVRTTQVLLDRYVKLANTGALEIGEANAWRYHPICTTTSHHRRRDSKGPKHYWGGAKGVAERQEGGGSLKSRPTPGRYQMW
jgi:hypothetical protein